MPGSRSIARSYGNTSCPLSVSFNYTPGPQPSIARMTLAGRQQISLGKVVDLQIGNALWSGFVSDYQYEENSDTTTLEAVDWRDRLQDNHLFAAFNMQDDDGRFYHIMPKLWKEQRKIYITRELDQQEFTEVQDAFAAGEDIATRSIAKNKLFSAYSILVWLSRLYSFSVSADEQTQFMLKQAYPFNLDWNQGVKVIDCIQQIAEKTTVSYCAYGRGIMHFYVRGVSQRTFLRSYLDGLVSACDIGGKNARIGKQFSDKGRRVHIQGDRNRYEYMFACHPNWNLNWHWHLAYGGFALAELLESLGLTTLNKIGEMPLEFRDFETWHESRDMRGQGNASTKRTRNEMTIQEYLDKIVFKCFAIDFNAVVVSLPEAGAEGRKKFSGEYVEFDAEKMELKEERKELEEYDRTPRPAGGIPWTIAERLPTEVNAQSIVYKTSRKITGGFKNPFFNQLVFIPSSSNASIHVEDAIGPDGKMNYKYRLILSEPAIYFDPKAIAEDRLDDPSVVSPDLPLVRIALEKDIYAYRFGEVSDGPRVREQRINVSNLSKSFVNNVEIAFLAESYASNLKKGGAVPATKPVKADDICVKIAEQALFHEYITSTGSIDFPYTPSIMPDSVVESVSVSLGKSGVNCSVSLGTPPSQKAPIIPPSVLRMSHKFLDETELNRRRLIWGAKKSMEEIRKAAEERERGAPDEVIAGSFAPDKTMLAAFQDGSSEVRYKKESIDHGFSVGDIIIAEMEDAEVA